MILVDSSVWIDHFRQGNQDLDKLLEKKKVCTAGIIRLEIVPFLLAQQGAEEEVEYFQDLPTLDFLFTNKDWEVLITKQSQLIQEGINGIGIADLLILHIAKIERHPLFTLDKNMKKAARILSVQLL